MMEFAENRKRLTVFVYLSIVAHFYLILLGSVVADKDILAMLQGESEPPQASTVIDNIIINTVNSSEEPEHGYISANPNAATAPVTGERVYNLFNPNMSPQSGNNGMENITEQADSRSGQSGAEQSQELPEDPNGIFTLPQASLAMGQSSDNISGDPTTTYFLPDAEVKVVMDSQGAISLPTIPREYAAYFTKMGEKIRDNWEKFFPVFQYYQGILKSGSIEVVIQLDRDGNVVDTAVVNSFGYGVVDEGLINAIRYSRNFGTLPADLPDGFRSDLSPDARARGDILIGFKYVFVVPNGPNG